ncbi:MAG: phosphoribulokinase [Methanomicrobiales archaeon]|nr:phosphoribulokinase [Methanomicrobiales archaeon]
MHFRDVIARSEFIFTIGVAGDSGSGKTTFTDAIRTVFGQELVSTITLDDYHRYDRNDRHRKGMTPLVPAANNIGLLERHLSLVKRGQSFDKPVYDHDTGMFAPPEHFTPTKIVIFEGLHTLFTGALRRNLDFTLFVDPDESVKREWKLKRDVTDRGYVEADVVAEMEKRKPDYERYIAPQKAFADAVVRIAPSQFGGGGGASRYRATILQRREQHSTPGIALSIDLASILALAERDFLLEFVVTGEKEEKRGALTVDGELHCDIIGRLERHVERETGISPVAFLAGKEYVSAIEIVRLILAWRIIGRRIALGAGVDDAS